MRGEGGHMRSNRYLVLLAIFALATVSCSADGPRTSDGATDGGTSQQASDGGTGTIDRTTGADQGGTQKPLACSSSSSFLVQPLSFSPTLTRKAGPDDAIANALQPDAAVTPCIP